MPWSDLNVSVTLINVEFKSSIEELIALGGSRLYPLAKTQDVI